MSIPAIVAICIAAALLGLIIILCVCRAIFTKRIKENSNLYKSLLELNKQYRFANISPTLKYSHECNSKRQLDNFNFDKNMRSIISSNTTYFSNMLNNMHKNATLKREYDKAFYELRRQNVVTQAETKAFKVPYKFWINREQSICEKATLKPTTSFQVKIRATYTSPQGRNSYRSDALYYATEVENFLNDIERVKKIELEKAKLEQEKREERERRKMMKPAQEIERGKLSKKLRYEILERDNYRCVICGRSAEDGVVLHVDHIIPVSKGGKTVAENLRTLCADCNIGKSDKLPKAN